MIRASFLVCSFAALTLAACASAPLPTERVTSIKAAMRSADELGANKTPQAALLLRLSQEELAQADALLKEGDEEGAERYLKRSKVDAELAIVLARQGEAQAEAEEALAAVAEIEKVNK